MRSLSVFLLLALAATATSAGQVNESDLSKTPWQFGLVGKARAMPIGLAFKTGVTAAVLRLLPDKTARVEIPCRNEEFIKKIGENLVYVGKWQLNGDELTFDVVFRGHRQMESGRVEVVGEEMRLHQANGVVRRLGEFYADVNELCRYE